MADYPNTERGEIKATIGGVDLILAPEMARIAKASAALDCDTIDDLYRRLTGGAPHIVLIALDIFTVSGDLKEAKANFKLFDTEPAIFAFKQILEANMGTKPGNGEGAGAALRKRPGATG